MKQTKAILIPLLVVVLMAAAYFTGRQSVSKNADAEIKQLQSVVDQFYPAPGPITALDGAIKSIVGARISLEINDPDDYLPHTDSSPRKTETRSANVLSNTIYTLIDYSKFNEQGNPMITKISLADLKAGDQITVRGNTDIKDAKSFDVIAVEKTIN